MIAREGDTKQDLQSEHEIVANARIEKLCMNRRPMKKYENFTLRHENHDIFKIIILLRKMISLSALNGFSTSK